MEHYPILDSLVVRIPACHAGGRGSIPRQGDFFYPSQNFPFLSKFQKLRRPGIEPGSQEWESCMIPLHQRRLPTGMTLLFDIYLKFYFPQREYTKLFI